MDKSLKGKCFKSLYWSDEVNFPLNYSAAFPVLRNIVENNMKFLFFTYLSLFRYFKIF